MPRAQVYRLPERLHRATADAQRCAIESVIMSDECSSLVLDGAAVAECDSHGVRLILTVSRLAQRAVKPLCLHHPSRVLVHILKESGFPDILPIVNSLPDEQPSAE